MKNPDLHIKNCCAQIKAQQCYTDLDSYQQCIVLQKIVEFKDFSRPLSNFPVLFKADLIFKDFSSIPPNSSTFQACGNPASGCLGNVEYLRLHPQISTSPLAPGQC